jgi:hypothetical protein
MTSLFQEYWHDEHHPLGAQLGLTITYNLGLGTLAAAAARRGLHSETPRVADILLVGVASFKLSRLIATERVTMAIRAPFVEGEDETPTGKGLRRALGEMMTCPYCVAPWAALGVSAGLVFAPKETRFVTAFLSSIAFADVLQRIYVRLGRKPDHSSRERSSRASGTREPCEDAA